MKKHPSQPISNGQKLILAILLPILILILTYGFITELMYWYKGVHFGLDGMVKIQWYQFGYTWWVWLISLSIIGGSEFWLFRPKD